MSTLILVRHGQSEWNLANRFTGWWDVDLTDKGVEEARAAGRLLKDKGVLPDIAFTSLQTRAIRTPNLALEECGRLWIPVTKDWHLNERHYGGLTGLDKQPMEPGSEYDPGADPRYEGVDVPYTESLKLTIERVLPYWEEHILPQLTGERTEIVSAHGNSLRALVKHLSGISDDEITGLEIPTGRPIIYRFEDGQVAGERRYLDET